MRASGRNAIAEGLRPAGPPDRRSGKGRIERTKSARSAHLQLALLLVGICCANVTLLREVHTAVHSLLRAAARFSDSRRGEIRGYAESCRRIRWPCRQW